MYIQLESEFFEIFYFRPKNLTTLKNRIDYDKQKTIKNFKF